MNDIPDETIADGFPVIMAEDAADHVGREAIVLVNGFGGVGYPKLVPETLVNDDRDRSLTVLSGGGVGGETDDALIDADQLARRYPFQTRETSREAINSGRVAFHDRHISRFGSATSVIRMSPSSKPSRSATDGWFLRPRLGTRRRSSPLLTV